MTTQNVTFELRRGTAFQWSNANPILARGEPGFATDTNILKIGDGVSYWSSLSAIGGSQQVVVGPTGPTGPPGGGSTYNTSTIDVMPTSILWSYTGTSITGGTGFSYTPDGGMTMDVLNIRGVNTSLAIGNNAGYNQSSNSVAIGYYAGNTGQMSSSVAIGDNAGKNGQQKNSVAIGIFAGANSQDYSAIAIGDNAGNASQSIGAVAIGTSAGKQSQGTNSIAIGTFAGITGQASNTIILNASGSELNGVSGQTGSFYVRPIRNQAGLVTPLMYNPTTYEIVQGSPYANSGVVGTINELELPANATVPYSLTPTDVGGLIALTTSGSTAGGPAIIEFSPSNIPLESSFFIKNIDYDNQSIISLSYNSLVFARLPPPGIDSPAALCVVFWNGTKFRLY
jgi:hypothetical protein